MTAALVGFLGVVVGLAVGFGYRFWATRREELMLATVAATLLRDAARAAQQDAADAATLSALWHEQRIALIRLMSPTDYEVLTRSIEAGALTDGELVTVLDRLTGLLWREHQTFILVPLIKYLRRDVLSDKLGGIVRELGERSR